MKNINEEDNENLCKPFDEIEIKDAIFQMETNKAAGPDGIPAEFYQTCWEIVKKDFVELFVLFHAGKLDLSRMNYGIITLIHKKKGVNRLQMFRPICLLNVCFKIFSKVLAIRFDPAIDKVVLRCQNPFIRGRNVTDGVMSLHEILHQAKNKKQQGVIFKIDFEKAYDKVNWEFLLNVWSYVVLNPLGVDG